MRPAIVVYSSRRRPLDSSRPRGGELSSSARSSATFSWEDQLGRTPARTKGGRGSRLAGLGGQALGGVQAAGADQPAHDGAGGQAGGLLVVVRGGAGFVIHGGHELAERSRAAGLIHLGPPVSSGLLAGHVGPSRSN